MKYILVFLAFFLAACAAKQDSPQPSAPAPTPAPIEISAADVLAAFKKAGFPITSDITYTADDDPNGLLGRPGQYIGKVNFSDGRSKNKFEKYPNNIEVFKNETDLNKRKAYTEQVTQSAPMFLQYIYAHKLILLRLEKDITPEQAAEYEKVLKSL